MYSRFSAGERAARPPLKNRSRALGSVGRAGPAMQAGPSIKTGGPVGTWNKGSNWKSANWQWSKHHHHNRFRNAAFIGVGFGAGFYGGYDSCWRLVPTYWGGWQRVARPKLGRS